MPGKRKLCNTSDSPISSGLSGAMVSKESEDLKSHSCSNRKKRITGNGIDRQEMIAIAAYYRAESRGFNYGDEMQDWLEAEVEMDNRV